MLESRYETVKIYEQVNNGFISDTFTFLGYYKGFMQPISGNEVFQKGKGGESASYRFYTGMRTPVKYGYRITIGNQSYMMLYAEQPTGISGTQHHKEIICSIFQ